jgi:hypothetical protein
VARTESRPSFSELVREPRSRLRAGLAILLVALAVAAVLLLTRGGDGEPVDDPDAARIAQAAGASSRTRATGDGADPGAEPSAGSSTRAASVPSHAPRVVSAAGAQGSVAGEVRSREGGTPVAGAELSFERDGVLASVITHADGSYLFAPERPGSWRLVSVAAEGYLPFAPEWGESAVSLRVLEGKQVEGATLWLRPAVLYTGVVLRPDGKPAPGADVRLFAASTDAALMPLHDRFRSDARGEFSFRAPPGSVLEARHARWGKGRTRLEFSTEVSHRLSIQLAAGDEAARAEDALSIEGVVRGPDGAPLEDAVVRASRAGGAFIAGHVDAPLHAASDAEGRYRIDGLEAGDYRVSASRAYLAPASLARVAAGTRADLELSAGGKLVGVVGDGVAPLASFTVQAFVRRGPLATELVRSVAAIDASGRFALTGLPPGPLLVSVAAPGYAPALDLAVSIRAEPAPPAELRVLLERGARLAGRVVDAETRQPIAGASVRLDGRAGRDGEAPLEAMVQSDARGAFVLEGVRAGSAAIMVAAAEHHARVLAGIEVRAGVATPELEVALRPTETDETPKLELAGLGLVLAARDDALMVGGLAPGGGGAEAGIEVGDGIVAVAGRLVTELGFEAAIAAIRGPENSQIALGIRRRAGGEPVTVVARRKLVRM